MYSHTRKKQSIKAKEQDLDGAQFVESARQRQRRHPRVLLAHFFTKLFIRHISCRQRPLQLQQNFAL